jgi:hypothetical protein
MKNNVEILKGIQMLTVSSAELINGLELDNSYLTLRFTDGTELEICAPSGFLYIEHKYPDPE